MRRLLICVCVLLTAQAVSAQQLIDKKATKKTKQLYANLFTIAQRNILFGHHEAAAYGVHWKDQPESSDVKSVCGSYPAVHGWDLGGEGNERNIDGVRFSDMHKMIREVYERGGINTISWHLNNPLTGENAWNKTPVVADLLPGGKGHSVYVKRLDIIADFLAQCKSGNTPVPIIFRPFHEHNGDWFWWGKGNCTEQEYINLWQFTVKYLRDEKKLHHLIYAFSPDRSRMNMEHPRESYLYAYPGDDYVDVLGYDNYMDVGLPKNNMTNEVLLSNLVTGLKAITALASEKKKVAAITETGLEGVTDSTWYTRVILNPVKSSSDIHLAYIMVWRNANEKHHYAPYPGHPSVHDFMVFYNDPYTLFESDLQNMYEAHKPLIR